MAEAERDAALWSHWIQDAEPDMLRGHEGRVFDLAFNPVYSGQLASASDDNSVRLWQIADDDQREISKQTGVCNGHKDSVLRVTWHSEGRLLASASADTTAQLWRLPPEKVSIDSGLSDGDPIQTLQGHPEEVYACEFVGENQLLTASVDCLFLWDLQSGACLYQAPGSQQPQTSGQAVPARWQPGYVFSAKTQPGGSLVATACSDGVLRVWDLRSQQLHTVCSLPLHEGMAAACAWDAHGHCLSSIATNGSITAMDMRTQHTIWCTTASCGLRDCCHLPNDMDTVDDLVAAGTDGALHVYHHRENHGGIAQVHSCQPQPQSLLCVNSSEDGTLLASAGGAAKAGGLHHNALDPQHHYSSMHDEDQYLIQIYSQGALTCV
ncbi:hypothetical protein WJX77_008173 [Trebouxia sp. C0004]